MSDYLTPLDVQLHDPFVGDGTGSWLLLQPFIYRSDIAGHDIVVPKGFYTDFASVPKNVLTWGLFGGRYVRPAVVHDFLTRQRYFVSREKSDKIFLEAMRLDNKLECDYLLNSGVDEDSINQRRLSLEGRASSMYFAVALYTKSNLWKTDVDSPDYNPIG